MREINKNREKMEANYAQAYSAPQWARTHILEFEFSAKTISFSLDNRQHEGQKSGEGIKIPCKKTFNIQKTFKKHSDYSHQERRLKK